LFLNRQWSTVRLAVDPGVKNALFMIAPPNADPPKAFPVLPWAIARLVKKSPSATVIDPPKPLWMAPPSAQALPLPKALPTCPRASLAMNVLLLTLTVPAATLGSVS
jgi:hypothetical protein